MIVKENLVLFYMPLNFDDLKQFVKSKNIYNKDDHPYSLKTHHNILDKFVKLISNYYELGQDKSAEKVLKIFNDNVAIESKLVKVLKLKNKNDIFSQYLTFEIHNVVNYDKLSNGLGHIISDLVKVTDEKLNIYKKSNFNEKDINLLEDKLNQF